MMASSPSKQAILSSYFSPKSSHGKMKRASSPIDLTVDEPASPPVKRTRASTEARSSPLRTPSRSTSVAEKWRFTPLSPENIQSQTPNVAAGAAERRKRHEAFKAKLLEDNSIFARKSSVKETDVDTSGGDEDGNSGNGTDKEPESDSDGGFRSLAAFFENKSKGKRKAAVRGCGSDISSKKKKSAEVGPSGQTYTPLELQVGSFSWKR
jgi:DNA mismatch repair protein MSH3